MCVYQDIPEKVGCLENYCYILMLHHYIISNMFFIDFRNLEVDLFFLLQLMKNDTALFELIFFKKSSFSNIFVLFLFL